MKPQKLPAIFRGALLICFVVSNQLAVVFVDTHSFLSASTRGRMGYFEFFLGRDQPPASIIFNNRSK